MENDGVVVTGSSVLDAFDRLEVLESTAEAIINARAIGEVAAMPEAVIRELREAFDIPFERPWQRFVEVIDIEDEAPFGRSVETEVR